MVLIFMESNVSIKIRFKLWLFHRRLNLSSHEVCAQPVLARFCLCALFSIDTDTSIITSVAGIYGPAFVGPVAKALNNKEIIISGITTGLIGYAIGNYLGILIGWWLQ